MSYSIGYDKRLERWVGYGVPAICDHPGCNKEIHRGLSYVCGNDLYGGSDGCGLHFCESHLETYYEINKETQDEEALFEGNQVCKACGTFKDSFTPKPDTEEWANHMLTDSTWQEWRDENPEKVDQMKAA